MASASPLALAVCRAFYGLNILGAGSSGLQLLLDDQVAVRDFWEIGRAPSELQSH